MSKTVLAVDAKYTLNLADFTGTLNNANKSVGQFARSTEKQFESIKKQFSSLSTSLSVIGGAAFWGIGESIKHVVSSNREIGESAMMLNTTADSMAKLKYAASLANIEFETLNAGLIRMERAGATSTGMKVLRSLNIDLAQFQTLNPEAKLESIIDHLAGVKNESVRAYDAITLFGRGLGAQMLKFVDDGKNKLREYIEEAKQIGIVLSPEQAKQYEMVGQNITRMSASFGVLGKTMTSSLLPAFNAMNMTITGTIRTINSFAKDYPTLTNVITTGTTGILGASAGFGILAFGIVKTAKIVIETTKSIKAFSVWMGWATAATKADTLATADNTAAQTANAVARMGIGRMMGTAALVGATAYGGWKVGRWIKGESGDAWGAWRSHANLGARSRELSSRVHVVNDEEKNNYMHGLSSRNSGDDRTLSELQKLNDKISENNRLTQNTNDSLDDIGQNSNSNGYNSPDPMDEGAF
jgi:hypothetical protein